MRTFMPIHSRLSPPQRTELMRVGSTKAIHIIKAFLTPLYSGIARIIQASPTIMRKETTNSASISFHIPSMSFLFSASVNFLSPWWIFIQSFPKIGPCQKAPPINMMRVHMLIAIQLRESIRKKWENKNILYNSRAIGILDWSWIYKVSVYFRKFSRIALHPAICCSAEWISSASKVSVIRIPSGVSSRFTVTTRPASRKYSFISPMV